METSHPRIRLFDVVLTPSPSPSAHKVKDLHNWANYVLLLSFDIQSTVTTTTRTRHGGLSKPLEAMRGFVVMALCCGWGVINGHSFYISPTRIEHLLNSPRGESEGIFREINRRWI